MEKDICSIDLAKDSYPEYTHNSYISIIKSQVSQLFKWTEDWNRHFTKEGFQTVNKHMKRCQYSLAVAAVIANHYQLGGLKQHKCFILQFWNQEFEVSLNGQKLRSPQRAVFFLEARGKTVPLFSLPCAEGPHSSPGGPLPSAKPAMASQVFLRPHHCFRRGSFSTNSSATRAFMITLGPLR